MVLVFYAMLLGCSREADKSVVEFVKDTKRRKSEHKEDLVKFLPIEFFEYLASELRDPFQPFVVGSATQGLPHPEGIDYLNRPREILEAYPLDFFQMVGTLERGGVFFALLREKTGIVHRASVGNYIGQNSGKIIKITQNSVKIQEWVLDSKGNWREHWASIQLLNSSNKIRG